MPADLGSLPWNCLSHLIPLAHHLACPDLAEPMITPYVTNPDHLCNCQILLISYEIKCVQPSFYIFWIWRMSIFSFGWILVVLSRSSSLVIKYCPLYWIWQVHRLSLQLSSSLLSNICCQRHLTHMTFPQLPAHWVQALEHSKGFFVILCRTNPSVKGWDTPMTLEWHPGQDVVSWISL